MSSTSFYCRFCAERKPSSVLIDLQTEIRLRDNIMERLGVFREVLVDLEDVALGAHVCGECYSMLESCAEWVSRVKRSQQLLGALCDSKSEVTLKVEVEECEGRGEDGGSWAAYSWSCGHCAAALPSMDALREHSKSAHTTCFGFKCADCDARPPPAFSDFVRHVRAHRHRLRNYCPYCDIKMEDDTHMELHLNEDRCETCGGMGHDMITCTSLHDYESEDILPQCDDKKPQLNNIAFPQIVCQPILQNIVHYTELNFPKSINISSKTEPEPTVITKWSSYPLTCRFCNETFYRRGLPKKRCAFVMHCMKEHKTCFGLRCVDCPETQESYLEFIEHVRRHRPELKSLCPYCDCPIDGTDSSHIKQHEMDEKLCVLCGKTYQMRRTLRRHQRETQSPLIKPPLKRKLGRTTEKDLTCDICGLKLATLHSVRCHKQTHIARERAFTCEECGKAFYTRECLVAHKRVHDAAYETCKICNTTVRRHCLKKHVETHNGKKEFQCDHCKRWFKTKNSIKDHIITHVEEKPLKCSYCGRGFRKKNVLDVHTRQHTGERPFKCDSCDKTFVNWSNCNAHMKRMHGTTLATYKLTPRGKIALNMDTLKPEKIIQNMEVQEWSQKVLEKKIGGRKKKVVDEINVHD